MDSSLVADPIRGINVGPMFEEFGINAGFVEELHARYLQSPSGVDEKWRAFFEGRVPLARDGADVPVVTPTDLAAPPVSMRPPPSPAAELAIATHASRAAEAYVVGTPLVEAPRTDQALAAAAMQGRVYQLVNAYRVRGHLYARIDPLREGERPQAAELTWRNFGLTSSDSEKTFATLGISGLAATATLGEIVRHLETTYCGTIGVEFTHIDIPEQRRFLEERMETCANRPTLSTAERVRILSKLTDAEVFEQFIHRTYVGAKRFSLEGAESMIPMLDLLVEIAGRQKIEEVVLGMAHRGRLNTLVNVMGKDVREIFAAFNDKQPERFLGSGDVKYHLGYANDVLTQAGRKVHLTLAFNPSHLEWVNPVVEGRARAKQDRLGRDAVMPVLIHGDASMMGQGVVAETLNLAGLEGYTTGGTIHIVVNNQIGFTTLPSDSRSTRYCTDISRMLKVPVFHVNGEDPEALIHATELATEYRQRYQQDVVIDIVCYRKYGHNEGDEPRFTQPKMYSVIDAKRTVREVYAESLVGQGVLTRDEVNAIVARAKERLSTALEEAKHGDFHKMPESPGGIWKSYAGGRDSAIPEVPTHVARERLLEAALRMTRLPDGFQPNAKVRRTVELRHERVSQGQPFDWGTAEHLAFATLLAEGHDIRLSGQDARRGTFSHRHAALYDVHTQERHVPLSGFGPGRFTVFDSPLSEAGVLGFEYGYSLERPDALLVWEAQFGDFLNCAQVVVDQFLSASEDKWARLSGLVLLLPHGYEGQGPEHSSARLERVLQLCAEDNLQVCNLTTPAQLFHAMRRQVLRRIRKPLFIFSPKSLLRPALSTVDDLCTGKFQRVIGDATVAPERVTSVLLCSGKVYYDLVEARKDRGRDDVAIVRVEQLFPLERELADEIARLPDSARLSWVQEEPANMGAWYYMRANAERLLGTSRPLALASRPASASPATGSAAAHQIEQKQLLDLAFGS